MPRTRCAARAGRQPAALDFIDAVDLPACMVFPDRGHGPCEDCVPIPTLRARLMRRLRVAWGKMRHGH